MVERDLAESRTQAQALILAGKIYAGNSRIAKAGDMLPHDAEIRLEGEKIPWVSRGGFKLDHALKYFGLNVNEKICLDIGASTGGFTDVLLQNGAAHVYAVDVGYGQLHEKIRGDMRVTVMERTNARYIAEGDMPLVDFICCDASFISLKTVLLSPLSLLKPGGVVVALIKPQFEAGKALVKGGVVRDDNIREAVCQNIKEWFEQQGLTVFGITTSPILGPKGNQEFLIYAAFQTDK